MFIYINIIKTMILAVRGFLSENLQTRASALTYNTLLAIVPMLAVLLGIAKGFGFQETVRQELLDYFPGHEMELTQAFEFGESLLAEAQGGVIIGVGLILLFYTVINLISSIEDTFNDIWQIQKSRPWYRKISDYLALFLVLPVLMTASSGLSIFMSTLQNSFLSQYFFFTPVMEFLLNVAPYVITVLAFTGLYILLPNTKVRFVNGLVAGTLAGIAFQFFQIIYISGQIWVSKYNAIYGSFAALPLLLLWLQLSWIICLFGAEISYASQNVKKFSFERDSKNISRRYKDFLTLLITSLIVKRFVNGEKPYTADELSDAYRIPIRITTQLLYQLTEMHILIEVNIGCEESKSGYPLEEAFSAYERLSRTEGLRVKGFMALLPLAGDEGYLGGLVDKMRALYDRAKAQDTNIEHLSMGMSGDWRLCLAHGSNMIRLGTAIFGSRTCR